MVHFRLRYERLRDAYQAFLRRRAMLRGAWLGLLVPLAGLLAQALAGVPPRPALWWIAALGVAAAAWWRLAGRRRAQPLGEALDRRLHLDALLATALEVDRRGPQGPIEHRLLDDAATVIAELGDLRPLLATPIRRERETLVAIALILAGAWLVVGSRQGLPPTVLLADLGQPMAGAGTGAGNSGSSDGVNPGPSSASGPGARAPSPSEQKLGAALADEAAARPLADALLGGDKAAAQAELERLAGQAGALSGAGRQGLADSLFAASDALEPDDPSLAEALRRAGRALERPDPAGDAGGLAALASALTEPASGAVAATSTPPPPSVRNGPAAARLSASAMLTSALNAASPTGPRASAPSAASGSGRDLPFEAPLPARPSAGGDAARQPASGPDPLLAPLGWQSALGRYFQAP